MNTPAYANAYYRYARSLGLCGRCKKHDALSGMAYCNDCRLAIQTFNRKRQGEPKRVYQSKFTRGQQSF